jgi:hypothetical protein
MKEIIIRTQKQLDELPDAFEEFTVIKIDTKPSDIIVVSRSWGSSSVEARGSSSVVARGSAPVEDRGSASVEQ